MIPKPKIAVIIPVYNCEKYIGKCLDTLIAQTYPNWIAYCVDDNSTDQSLNICLKYSMTDSRIKILANHTNLGAAGARNRAIELINSDKSEWIAFIDADDYIQSTRFEDIISAINLHSSTEIDYVRLFSARTTSRNADTQSLNNNQQSLVGGKPLVDEVLSVDEYFNSRLVGGCVCSLFVKSKLVIENGLRFPTDMRILEDQVFSIKCALLSRKILMFSAPGYFYYENPESVLHQKKRSDRQDIIKCIQYLYNNKSVRIL